MYLHEQLRRYWVHVCLCVCYLSVYIYICVCVYLCVRVCVSQMSILTYLFYIHIQVLIAAYHRYSKQIHNRRNKTYVTHVTNITTRPNVHHIH